MRLERDGRVESGDVLRQEFTALNKTCIALGCRRIPDGYDWQVCIQPRTDGDSTGSSMTYHCRITEKEDISVWYCC